MNDTQNAARVFDTPCGGIRYWVAADAARAEPQLVFLHGLTADHRLFERQFAHFAGRYPSLVWDAPGHAASRPFSLAFGLTEQAVWLDGILTREGFDRPVIVGQSMGGYVGQEYARLFPEKLAGFVSIDSAPLGREYVTGAELWLLKRMEPVYRHYPWRALKRAGVNGVAETEYGRSLMRDMMKTYDGERAYYAKLAGQGYRMLAEAMEAGLSYEIRCPALLICGERDRAGSCVRYNRAWHKRAGLPLEWVKNAGHNANTDAPETVNRLIERLLASVRQEDEPCTASRI